jgi:hypothetical protein
MKPSKLILSLLALLLTVSFTTHASSQIRNETDFIRLCLGLLVPDAVDSLKIDCVAQNANEQSKIAKYNLLSIDLQNADIGTIGYNNQNYFQGISITVGGIFNKKAIDLDCSQDVQNPNTVEVGRYSVNPISLRLESLIDRDVKVSLTCKAAR